MNQFVHFFFNSKVIYEASITPNSCQTLSQVNRQHECLEMVPAFLVSHLVPPASCPNPPHISSHGPWSLVDAQVFLVTEAATRRAAARREQDC